MQEHDVIGLCRLLESAPMGIGYQALSKVIRSQHALIVQMREALSPFAVYGRPGSRDVEVGEAIAALTAANDYLGQS